LQHLGVSKMCTAPWFCIRMAWLSATLEWSRSTCVKLLHHTRGIGTQDDPSYFLLTGHPLTTLQSSPQLA
jgi:hypothetical protein